MNLAGRSPLVLWAMLIGLSAVVTSALVAVHLPGAMMLGPMISGIVMAANGARLSVPRGAMTVCIGIVACLVARSIDPPLLRQFAAEWPGFLLGSAMVIVFGVGLGVAMARLRLLPGTTAIWGSSPGAAMVMLVMAREARADVQLVAVMLFMRLAIVAGLVAVVARLFGPPGDMAAAMSAVAPVPFSWGPFLATLALGTGVAFIGARLPLPGLSVLLPMFVAIILSNTGVLPITQPDWVLVLAYVTFGWSIGLGFTRESLLHAGRMLPRIIGFALILSILCAMLAYAMHRALDIDMLTAFLATSPCGLDLIAVIAASTHADMGLVMGMQIARFLLISLAGPTCIAMVARWTERSVGVEEPAAPALAAPDDMIEPKSASAVD